MKASLGLTAALLTLGATTLPATPKPVSHGVSLSSPAAAISVASGGCRTTEMHVIAGGGVRMQGAGGLTAEGTAGQPGAAMATGAGGLALAGGFWRMEQAPADEIFCNGFD